MKIAVGVSARHIHLTNEVYNNLFFDEIEKRNDLTQTGEYASLSVLTIKTDKGSIDNVRVLGPLRNYNQIEISKTDAIKLGINPPVRKSGDVLETPGITLIGPKGEVTLDNGVILAKRHIHMSSEFARKYNIKEDSPIKVRIDGVKGLYKGKLCEEIIAFSKVSDNFNLEMHIDTDEANAFLLKNGDEVEILV